MADSSLPEPEEVCRCCSLISASLFDVINPLVDSVDHCPPFFPADQSLELGVLLKSQCHRYIMIGGGVAM